MAVGTPAAGMQIHFDIALFGDLGVPLDYGSAKVGSGFTIPEPWVEHSDDSAIHGSQPFASNALMEPKELKQFFGRGRPRGGILTMPRHGTKRA